MTAHRTAAPEMPEDFKCDKCKKPGTTNLCRVLVRLPRVCKSRLRQHHGRLVPLWVMVLSECSSVLPAPNTLSWGPIDIVRLNRIDPVNDQRVECSIDFPDVLDLKHRMHLGSSSNPSLCSVLAVSAGSLAGHAQLDSSTVPTCTCLLLLQRPWGGRSTTREGRVQPSTGAEGS